MDIDVVFIVPNNSNKIYQDLSVSYSAIETPTWALLLAESSRSKGSGSRTRRDALEFGL